jgi:hypothetical protein
VVIAGEIERHNFVPSSRSLRRFCGWFEILSCLPTAVLAEAGGRLRFALLRVSQIVLIYEGASFKTYNTNPNFRPFRRPCRFDREGFCSKKVTTVIERRGEPSRTMIPKELYRDDRQ